MQFLNSEHACALNESALINVVAAHTQDTRGPANHFLRLHVDVVTVTGPRVGGRLYDPDFTAVMLTRCPRLKKLSARQLSTTFS